MLQAVSFLPMFRGQMGAKIGNERIDKLVGADDKESSTLDGIYSTLTKDKSKAATMAVSFLNGNPAGRKALIDEGRRLVFLKGTDSHDYKFSSAVLEDYYSASPVWRDRYLASSLLLLPGSGDRDNNLVKRTRSALQA